MRNHEDFSSANNYNVGEPLEFGARNLPEYVQEIWKKKCSTFGAEGLNDLMSILEKITVHDYEDAASIIKGNYLDNGSMMSMVAVLLPEGADVIRKVYTDIWGESGLAQSKDFLDGCTEWHEKQQKIISRKQKSEHGRHILTSYDYENEYGPTTREKFMNRVHDTFGPDEARMLAYLMRRAGSRTYRTSYDRANSIICERDEPAEIIGLEQWEEKVYRRESAVFGRNFANIAKTFRDESNEKAAVAYENMLDKINQFLANPDTRPSYGDAPFPETMSKQEGGIFMHCYDAQSVYDQLCGKNSDETYGKIEARLYMCPRTDVLTDFIDEFKRRCYGANQKFYFKYSRYPDRTDRFIVYTNYDRINGHLKILNDMKEQNPELFEDMDDGSRNPFWGEIDGAPGGVYFGEEPAWYPRDFEMTSAESGLYTADNDDNIVPYFSGYSYSGLRAEVFDLAFDKWTKDVYGEIEERDDYGFSKRKNAVHFNSPIDISWKDAEYLELLFREELDAADIDPGNLCFDKYPNTTPGARKRTKLESE